MSKKVVLKRGEEITINVLSAHTVGKDGFNSGKVLETIEDSKNEVIEAIDNADLNDVYGKELYIKIKNMIKIR